MRNITKYYIYLFFPKKVDDTNNLRNSFNCREYLNMIKNKKNNFLFIGVPLLNIIKIILIYNFLSKIHVYVHLKLIFTKQHRLRVVLYKIMF